LWRFQPEKYALKKQWLAELVNKLTPAGQDDPGEQAVNLALTASGLRRLGTGTSDLNSFSFEFLEGMAPQRRCKTDIPRRTNILGDMGASSPELWDWGGWENNGEIDGLLLLYARDDTSLKALVEAETKAMQGIADGAPIVLKGRFYDDMKEHFGYVDGLSQPKIEGRPKRENHEAVAKDDSRIKPGSEVKPGEFLLGYLNERGARIANGQGRDIRRNGTYLVFRQLEQNVEAFIAFLSDVADRIGENEEWVAAHLLGRWRNGNPLVMKWPTAEANAKNPGEMATEAEASHPQATCSREPAEEESCPKPPHSKNDFLYYYEDRSGLMCPIGAHIRRANPRDSLGPDPETALRLSKMHRIIRRGRPYGERLQAGANRAEAEKAEAEKAERGMLFIALNADIAGQFEMIQHSWLNNPHFNGLYTGTDPISHFSQDEFITIQGRPANFQIRRPAPFVTVRGGAYFFLPGILALRQMAAPT
jgi:Dyp-type peroxidase family